MFFTALTSYPHFWQQNFACDERFSSSVIPHLEHRPIVVCDECREKVGFDVHTSVFLVVRATVGFRLDVVGNSLAGVGFQLVGLIAFKCVTNRIPQSFEWVIVDGKEGEVAREFDDSVLVTVSLTNIFRQVNPAAFVREFRHPVCS